MNCLRNSPRMNKIISAMFCLSICLAVVFMFPNEGKTHEKVTEDNCLHCHLTGMGNLHDKHENIDCEQCHDGTPELGNVSTSPCLECHPFKNPGDLCTLVKPHAYVRGGDCFYCHTECIGIDTTTSTTTSTSEEPCSAETIFGEHSEEIELLRDYRNEVLSKTPEGQEMIRLYYQWSPIIVKAMKEDEVFKEDLKTIIDGILPLIERDVE